MLWTNPNPYSSFSPQPIEVDTTDYRFVAVFASLGASNSHSAQMFLFYNAPIYEHLFMSIVDDTSQDVYKRSITKNGNRKTFNVESGYVNQTQNNSACIPRFIYGIK